MKMHLFLSVVVFLDFCWGYEVLFPTSTNHTIMKAQIITKPGCQKQCGNLLIPYPFGIKVEGLDCAIDPSFELWCNDFYNPPLAFSLTTDIVKHQHVHDISDTEVRVNPDVAHMCYNQSGGFTDGSNIVQNGLDGTPFTFSTANVLTAVGCDDYANLYNDSDSFDSNLNNANRFMPKGCSTTCLPGEEIPQGECSGIGCCQVPVNVQKNFNIYLGTYNNHTNVSSFNKCGFAFIGEKSRFKFRGISDLIDTMLNSSRIADIPVVLDWAVGDKNCSEAALDQSSYACKSNNSYCLERASSNGYRCSCKEGFEGNPYLSPGCYDIDECANKQKKVCDQICTNTQGSYYCSCRYGYYFKDDKCNVAKKFQIIKLVLGIGFSCLVLLIGMNWLYFILMKRKHAQQRDKFFQRNGGLLLSQISKDDNTKVFSNEELKRATNNYATDRILGQGGYGIVYKGILPDNRVVAIKKSKVMDESQVEQFINEVVILTQVNHRNVVKLLGCCLEYEVPLLVYEFVSNGTLLDHVHNNDGGPSWLSLDNRLRIAVESSSALAYLHSAASIPIIHRDVKLANILLDDNNVAKISDFGASRLVPMDQTKVTTLVQGTLGYLDPEYFHTGQLTNKSDVYSFGVVLAELLTGRKPICMANPAEERNLGTFFITSMNKNRLFQILEPRVVKEGMFDQLEKVAQLVKRCLNLHGADRPTMMEVATEIQNLRKFTKHPWPNQLVNEDITSLIGHSEIQLSDLYDIHLNTDDYVKNDSD